MKLVKWLMGRGDETNHQIFDTDEPLPDDDTFENQLPTIIKLQMSGRVNERMEALRRLAGEEDAIGVIRNAIAVYEMMMNRLELGDTIQAVSKDGEVQELTLTKD
jgi:hypothetical protein